MSRDPGGDGGWDSFFDPRSVCVVGASVDPSRIGGRLVRYPAEAGYTGLVVPVNPHHRSVFGIPAVPSLSKVEAPPDWVVVAVPAARVPEVVAQAGEIGARNVAVVASGFAEVGPAGAQRQRQLRATARRYGMRLLGPNSNGFMHPATGAFFAFTPVIDSARPAAGELAIVTQSAALGTYLLNCCHRAGLGVRHWVHTGNEADTTLLDVTAALARRGEVRAIALCVEVLRDLPALRGTLRALAGAGIPVGVLPAGRSPAGRRASQAHTAALIGDEAELLADLFAHGGAQVCGSIAELADFLQVAVDYPDLPARPRIGLVTTSGGVGVLAADAFAAARLPMPVLSGEVQERIRSYAPFAHPANPVDTTAQVINEPDAFPRILLDCLDSGELDLVTVFVAHGLAGMRDRTLRQLVEVAQRRGGNAGQTGPSLAAVGILSPEAARELQRRGVAALSEPAALSRAVRGRLDSAARQAALLTAPEPAATTDPPDRAGPTTGTGSPDDRLLDDRLLDEWSAKELLRRLGAPVVPGRLVGSPDDAVAAAGELGYPVVLKLSSPRLPHKAAAGGLRLHLWTPAAVRTAYQDLAARGRDLPGEPARLLLERQVSGPELFVGCVRHPRLGRLVGIGPGGSGVEQTRAVRWHWAPVRAADVAAASPAAGGPHAAAVARLTGRMLRLLDPDRGRPGGPWPCIHTVEVNPVILTEGGGAVVADALVALAGPEEP
jgi:acyl-CoA synthetase (NDP forming)